MRVGPDIRSGEPERHVRVKQRTSVLNMLRRLDKIRFRGHKRDDFLDLAESPNASDTECSDEIPLKVPRTSPRDSEELRDPAGPGTLIMATGVQDFNRTEFDRLNEIKGHLEIALLEKHFLQEELRKLREETNAEMLRQELDRERQRRMELEQKVQEVLKARTEEQMAQQPPKGQAQASNGAERRSQGLSSRLQKWFYERFGEYVEDFRFQPEENTVETEEPLSARRLTENMRRLKRGAKPVTNFVKNLSALSDWYSVYTSAIAFTVYMNAVWHGWAIPLFLFLAILRLSLNYLIARGWRIQWSIVPEVSEPVEPPKEDLTVSEKFQLVLDVAQKAQNLFGKMADILEKIKNLFMWVQPEITQKLYVALWAAFLASCFFPYRLVGLAVGLYAGIKFFLIDFIFKRCPRLRAKYDTPYIIWRSLPTDPQLKERSSAAVSRRLQTTSSRSYVPSAPAGLGKEEDAGRFHSTKKGNFHEIFNLTENERPLAVCENGWRCCLINRDRKMPTDYIRNGVLYVTENYLCFESSKSGSSKRNKVIKLVDITDIQKYKVLSVLPGSGMGIAVSTPSTQKPLVFGAMVHRDEAFETILSQYIKITSAAASGGDS
ncbi:GRAM domain-containing protein 4 isoform X1 [Gorilla gorilla gorilla]|uniref:GRAM domain-containing protein 4 isoform X2 n=1 Tax=Homo sapiens TaxID=9606 RepID=UPI000387D160|nr:GRAM domain-containing protein 4 isoform X2 [Homo sapiens]XP_054181260.1 GRAM domain-containing protein 4 isoform X2 [Homo sapiens]|eukprot:XP_005261453.1 GRAM domain-containing protein 4 isoform X3 [Homo sapiens]